MASIRLNRPALVAAVRSSMGFRVITKQLENRAVRTGRAVAAEKVTRRTGVYEDSFSATFVPIDSKTILGRLRLQNDAEQAEIIEKGSRPHLIRVRKARVLVNTETGDVFGVQVNHPGTQPQHVIRTALQRVAGGRGQ